MPLTSEDTFRLNVLLANEPLAIRINESSLNVHALSAEGASKVQLSPNCRAEQYLTQVRELLSGHVMGSPGGYPVFLKRWTRMGQARDDNLAQLLLLGEPEAVVAVVHAEGLTDELAKRAWWACQDAEHARRMLMRECVVEGEMGSVLADYLVEFLPFEENPLDMVRSIRMVLQPGLISDEACQQLWTMGQRKNAILLGFMRGLGNPLPEPSLAHQSYPLVSERLQQLSDSGNKIAELALLALSESGQTYINTASKVLKKPLNQDIVNELLDTLASAFEQAKPDIDTNQPIENIIAEIDQLLSSGEVSDAYAEVTESVPELSKELESMMLLACLGYPVVRPVFSKSDAIGSLMRRKLEPITKIIFLHLNQLLGKHA